MMSDLSSFAARVRDFISRCSQESPSLVSDEDSSQRAYPEPQGRARLSPARRELEGRVGVAGGGALRTTPPYLKSVRAQNASPQSEAEVCREEEFNALALALFALQFEHNPPYRRFCEARKSSPGSFQHWSQIPAVPTSAFKELELTCLPVDARTAVFHSSGTTEQRPSRHFHSAESLSLYEASLWPWFQAQVAARIADSQSPIANRQSSIANRQSSMANRQSPIAKCQWPIANSQGPIANRRSPIANGQSNIGSRQSSIGSGPSAIGYRLSAILLTPPPAHAPHSSLVHMFEMVRRHLNEPESAFVGEVSKDGTWTLAGDETLGRLRNAAHQGQPVILLGTAFSFVHLLDLLAEKDLRLQLPPGSRVMETGGYKGRSRSVPKRELHALIVDRLGIPPAHIVSEYGMSELSSQAYDGELRSEQCEVSSEGRRDRIFRFPPWVRFQIVSPETGRAVGEGETGLLQVFDLANVFSVMAVQTEDLAIRRGDGFELLGRAELAEARGCSLMLQ